MIRLFPAALALWLGLCIGAARAVEVPTCEQIGRKPRTTP